MLATSLPVSDSATILVLARAFLGKDREMSILRQDDFEVDMYITVLRGKIYTPSSSNPFGPFSGGATTETEKEDGSFKSDVLQITAICMPYITVKICGSIYTRPATFDTREWLFMKLSPEYVEAAKKGK